MTARGSACAVCAVHAVMLGGESPPSSRQLHTIEYDLEATYEGLNRHIVRQIEALNLAHYSLEGYKRSRQEQDDFALGRQVALVGNFKSRFLKRLESSIEAFRISIRRALEFVKTFAAYVQDGIILAISTRSSASPRKITR